MIKKREGAISRIAKKRKIDQQMAGILIPAQHLGRRGAQWKRDQQE
jgi:hypothetical protein